MKEVKQTKRNNSKDKVYKGFSLSFEEQSQLKVRLQSQQRLWMAMYQSQNIQYYYEKLFTPQNIPNNIIQVYDSIVGIYQFILQNYEKDLSVGFDDQKNFCEVMMKTKVGKKEKVYHLALQKVEYCSSIKISSKIKTLENEINKNNELLQRYRLIEEELKLKLQKEQSKTTALKESCENIQLQIFKNRAKQQQDRLLRAQRKQKIQSLDRQIAQNQQRIIQKGSIQNQHFADQKGRKRKQFQLINNQISVVQNKLKKETTYNNRSSIMYNKISDKEQKINQKISTQRLVCSEMAFQKQKIRQPSASSIIKSNASQYVIREVSQEQNKDQFKKSNNIVNQTNIAEFDQNLQSADSKHKQVSPQKNNCHTSFQNLANSPQNKQICFESKLLKSSIQSKSIPNQSINWQMHNNTSPSVSSTQLRVCSQKGYCFQKQIGEKVTLNLGFSNNIGKYQLIKTKGSQLLKRTSADQLFHFIANSTAITGRQHFVAIIQEIRFQDFNFGIRASSTLNVPCRQWHSKIICLAGCCKKLVTGTDYTNIQLQLKRGDIVVTIADMIQRKVWFYVNKILVKEIKLVGQGKEDWYFFVDSCTKDNTIRLI